MFLSATTAGLVASATMSEAGPLSEFLDWLRRCPVSVDYGKNALGKMKLRYSTDGGKIWYTVMSVHVSPDVLSFREERRFHIIPETQYPAKGSGKIITESLADMQLLEVGDRICFERDPFAGRFAYEAQVPAVDAGLFVTGSLNKTA
jgi:hypothetical protein